MTLKISQLEAHLARARQLYGDVYVQCTWESTTPDICGIYLSREGVLLIDSDTNYYTPDKKHPSHEVLYEADF